MGAHQFIVFQPVATTQRQTQAQKHEEEALNSPPAVCPPIVP